MGTSFATIAEKDRSTIILNELCAVEYSVDTRMVGFSKPLHARAMNSCDDSLAVLEDSQTS